MLTKADKQFLVIVGFLLITAIVSSITIGLNSEETVWHPDGLYVLAYTGSPFLEEELPSYVDQFSAQTGRNVNVVLTTDWDEAMIRTVAHDMPIDVVMVPLDMRDELRREGQITELHTVLDDFPNLDFQTAMRWRWSSIDDRPICGFLIGEFGDPMFACIWYKTKRAKMAAEFIQYLVVNTSVSESRLVQANHFARKFLVEKDYGPIYDLLLHPLRREVMDSRMLLGNRPDRCPSGVIQDVRVTGFGLNPTAIADPMTGVHYEREEFVTYRVEYNCIQGGRLLRGGMSVIQILKSPFPNVFIPDASYDGWMHSPPYLEQESL